MTSDRERDLLEANNRYLEEARIARRAAAGGFQARVDPWLLACFGEAIARDRQERSHRLLEEVLELVQTADCTASEAHQLVDYVFARPVGEMDQEIGGVMNTLAAFCLAHGHDMAESGERELARVWTKIEKIRAKQAAKPKHSPLPEHVPADPTPDQWQALLAKIEAAVLTVAKLQEGDREWGRLHQKVIEERAAALREVDRLAAELEKARSATNGAWKPTHYRFRDNRRAAYVGPLAGCGNIFQRENGELFLSSFNSDEFTPIPPQAAPATAGRPSSAAPPEGQPAVAGGAAREADQ